MQSKTRRLVLMAVMAAVSIVLGKYLAITVGALRLSLENLPVLMAGVILGPMAGLAVGVVADLMGSLLVGYSINPIITLGAGAIGWVAGAVYWRGGFYSDSRGSGLLAGNYLGDNLRLAGVADHRRLAVAVGAAHLVGSCVIKSLGLYIYYAYPVGLLLLRVPLYAVIGICEYSIMRATVPALHKIL